MNFFGPKNGVKGKFQAQPIGVLVICDWISGKYQVEKNSEERKNLGENFSCTKKNRKF